MIIENDEKENRKIGILSKDNWIMQSCLSLENIIASKTIKNHHLWNGSR